MYLMKSKTLTITAYLLTCFIMAYHGTTKIDLIHLYSIHTQLRTVLLFRFIEVPEFSWRRKIHYENAIGRATH